MSGPGSTYGTADIAGQERQNIRRDFRRAHKTAIVERNGERFGGGYGAAGKEVTRSVTGLDPSYRRNVADDNHAVRSYTCSNSRGRLRFPPYGPLLGISRPGRLVAVRGVVVAGLATPKTTS